MRFIILIIFSSGLFATPWIDLGANSSITNINDIIKGCNIYLKNINSYPASYGSLYKQIDEIDKNDLNDSCVNKLSIAKKYIESKYNKKRTLIGFQSGHDNLHIQSLGNRKYKNDNIFFLNTGVSNNFSYNIFIRRDIEDNKTYFDDTYLSYKYGNNVFSIGKKSRWWSPSSTNSLLISNSARPSLGVEYRNYIPIIPEKKLFSFLGEVNYEFFVNRLEKDRFISNALLFGNRVSISPNDRLDISLMRVAQFGGKGRPTDFKTVLNMLIGRDNTSNNLSFDEQPGNQLAGFDFNLYPIKNNNLRIYGQLIGEDEAGYLPSRQFYLIGFSNNLKRFDIPTTFSFDYIDTFSGKKNYTYNHGLYKTGLRYKGLPIGASIDADSSDASFNLQLKPSNKSSFIIRYRSVEINKNSSVYNSWSNTPLEFNEINLEAKYKYKKFNLDATFIMRDKKPGIYDKNYITLSMFFDI